MRGRRREHWGDGGVTASASYAVLIPYSRRVAMSDCDEGRSETKTCYWNGMTNPLFARRDTDDPISISIKRGDKGLSNVWFLTFITPTLNKPFHCTLLSNVVLEPYIHMYIYTGTHRYIQ